MRRSGMHLLGRGFYFGALLLGAAGAQACCVAGETRVRTPRGEVAAGSLRVGDAIYSVDPRTGVAVEATLVQVRRATRECVALRWAGGALVCTPDHPLYDPTRTRYRPASDWISGDARALLECTSEGVRAVEVAVTEVFAGVHEVIDLTVDAELHNFVAAGVLAHNKSPPDPDESRAQEAGPELELTADDPVRRYRVRVCLDGGELGGDHSLTYVAEGDVAPDKPPRAQQMAMFIEADGEELSRVEAMVPDTWRIDASEVPASCGAGHVIGFEREPEPGDGGTVVTWVAEVAMPYDESLAEDPERLKISFEPEP